MGLGKRIRNAFLHQLLPMPVECCETEYSAIVSVGGEGALPPTPRLIALTLEATRAAQQISLEDVRTHRRYPMPELSSWPGSLYRFLAGVVTVMQPRLVIEIGTAGGLSALAIQRMSPTAGRLVTFDVVDWRQAHQPVLEERDFADQRLIAHVADLSQLQIFETYRQLFQRAELIFLDAAKDGVLEQRLLDLFETVTFQQPPVLLLDDIRVWNMIRIWHEIRRPKLDVTSFGHWRGTGLVDWVIGDGGDSSRSQAARTG